MTIYSIVKERIAACSITQLDGGYNYSQLDGRLQRTAIYTICFKQ